MRVVAAQVHGAARSESQTTCPAPIVALDPRDDRSDHGRVAPSIPASAAVPAVVAAPAVRRTAVAPAVRTAVAPAAARHTAVAPAAACTAARSSAAGPHTAVVLAARTAVVPAARTAVVLAARIAVVPAARIASDLAARPVRSSVHLGPPADDFAAVWFLARSAESSARRNRTWSLRDHPRVQEARPPMGGHRYRMFVRR